MIPALLNGVRFHAHIYLLSLFEYAYIRVIYLYLESMDGIIDSVRFLFKQLSYAVMYQNLKCNVSKSSIEIKRA